MTPPCKTPRSDPLRVVVLLALSVASGTWCADASAAPVTAPDAATTSEDTSIDVPVLANDFDDTCTFPGCPPTLLRIANITQPDNGTVEIDDRGPQFQPDVVRYTPRNNFFGTDTFTYTAFGFGTGESSPTTVTITVTPVNDAPDAVDDAATTGQGKAVSIAVLANDTDIDGDALTIASLTQPANGTATQAGNSVTYTPNANFSGTDRFTYRARDTAATSAPADVTVTVTPNIGPTAVITGGNRTIPDSDRNPGENVQLDGSGSTDPDGTIVSYRWFNEQQTLIGSGPTIDVRLPDGDNVIQLVVTDNSGATGSSTVTLTVAMPSPRTSLQELPDLTPNERSVAVALDDLCLRLSEQSAQTEGESELLARCDGIVLDTDPTRQTNAVSELSAQDLNAIRTETLLLAGDLSVGVLDRLMALRSGARGLSAAPGLNLIVQGKTVPPEMLAAVGDQVMGGSNEDTEEPDGLLGERWGFWMRGTFGSSEKDATTADPGFDADQWVLTGGIDYRNPEQQSMFGLAVGFGEADTSFNPSDEGGVDITGWSLSLYGGVYPVDSFFYADAFVTYGQSSLDTERRIHYQDAAGTIDRTAEGSTDGSMLSAGISVGHDFLVGQLTVSPNARVFYVDATVDGFQESGASGLDLIYDKQDFESATASVGVRITSALNLGWVVLLPHFQADAVFEFSDQAEVFGVQFANDPFVGTANPTPPITVTSDTPDQSFVALALGVAAQLRYGVSGYIEYQRLEGLESLKVADLSLGMRVQYSFR